ncbi:MAG: UbiA family prenyltransferase [Candidatus Thermoplasmatota archaeon]|nr:UbiA family prenyltransferase [Candidatus Thermoplasmatota archaeon]
MKTSRFFFFLIHSNIYLAVGASSLVLMTMLMLNVRLRWEPMFIAFCGTFFLYTLNRKTDTNEDTINYPERITFLNENGKMIFYLSMVLFFFSLVLASLNGPVTFVLGLTPFLLCLFYGVFRFKRIFFFKDLMVSSGWAIIAFLAASYYSDFSLVSFLVFTFIFLRVTITTIVFDIKDVQGDRIYGIKTIPETYGLDKTKQVLYLTNTICAVFLLLITLSGIHSLFYILFVDVFYCYYYLSRIGKMDIKYLCDVLADGEYVLIGFLSILLLLLSR